MVTKRKGKVKGMMMEVTLAVLQPVDTEKLKAEVAKAGGAVEEVQVSQPEPLHKRVILLGAGGVGFWLGVALSRAGVEYEVWDDDDFTGGLGHTRLPLVENRKTKKVQYLRGFVMATMGDAAPTIFPTKFSNREGALEGALIIDATDMALATRKKIWTAAREAGARLLRVSYDGAGDGIVAVSEGLPFANGRVGGGYTDVPTLALSFVAGGVGAIAVQRALRSKERLEFQISLSDLMKPFVSKEEVA